MQRVSRILSLLALLLAVPRAAGAEEAVSSPAVSGACPSGNLLAGKRPYHWADLRGRVEQATDGVVANEGAIWDAPLGVILETGAATISWDLGAVTTLNAAWVQADANDYYTLWGSLDGKTWKDIGRIEPAEGVHGLRARKVGLGGVAARYVRFGEGQGDSFYSLSELQLFCELPQSFPPPVRVQEAPRALAPKGPFWDNDTSARWELGLALLGFALLQWGYLARRRGRLVKVAQEGEETEEEKTDEKGDEKSAAKPAVKAADDKTPALVCPICHTGFLASGHVEGESCTACAKRPERYRTVRDVVLGVLGVLAALTYINFGSFHFGNFIHDWEWTHYYVGSKYFPELGYDRLYECMAVADMEESPTLKRRVELRKITNLRTNHLESTEEIVKHPESCKQHFSAARWEAFRNDVRYWRNRQGAKRWDDLQTDHGYNGTPVWNIAGTKLANLGPASDGQLWTLAMLDPLYLIATIAIIWWAFGWRVLAVALMVFATNFPSRFYWTGGSFLRWDWLFYTVAGIACLRKDRPMLAGASLAYATLLRIFPGFVFLGPLIALGIHVYKHRKLEPRYTRFFVGAAIAVVVLMPLSLAVSGGIPAYKQFIANTQKHKETPLTNYMGLRTVVAWRPSEVGRLMKNDKLSDPWQPWKSARLRAFHQSMPLYVVLVLAFLVLVGLAVRSKAEPWMAAALGVMIIPMGVELTCYYYAFLIGAALLYEKREEVGRWLLLLTAFTQFAAWAPLPGMAKWIDEQYTLMSAATVAVFGVIVWLFRDTAAAAAEGPALAGAEPPAPTPSDDEAGKKKKRR